MKDIFLSPYNPIQTEGRIYEVWEQSGFFNPDNLPNKPKETYTVILPPPNVTGVLHLGHAYEDSLQDAAVRYQRMKGMKVLWVPGTDSAAIATQQRVEKNIQKEEGKTRHDLGREELVKRVKEFAKNSENTILSQVKRMGTSLDWSRYAYTLDDKRVNAVTTAFIKMYEAGLIYRGYRIVNWDPKGQTTISDDEVVHEESKGKLYTFKYSHDFPISIATTRPETKFGDTAIAVNPKDERYKQYIGKKYDVDFAGQKLSIQIISEPEIDPEFGTGAVGITPAHSMTDWDIAQNHKLPAVQVINEYAKMANVPEQFANLKTIEAREKVVEWLKTENLLEKEEDVNINISTSERTGAIVEPILKMQWFVAVDKEFEIPYSEIPTIKSGSKTTLKQIMKASVESGAVDMPQEGFRKTYFHWIENLHDWCISRQIWFGHRIPVWYKGEETLVQIESPGDDWSQESDVLDTWFSSALWPMSTLGWPENTNDMENYFPTNFMSPAYEILQLWISRMILMSGFFTGKVPFKKVLIHGLVRDKQGRKFSKSLGNGIDPIEIIEKYGADALRMGLLVGTPIGSDVRFDESKVKAYKLFANKIWNITRFVLSSTENYDGKELSSQDIVGTDLQYIEEMNTLIEEVTSDMENYRFYLSAEKLYHYVWHTFADKIIEESKEKLKNSDPKVVASAQYTLRHLLFTSLKLLHPFMPFITEEIWGNIDNKSEKNLLMVTQWPSKK